MPYTIVNGSNANDLLSFQGIVQSYDQTLVNPYSGYTVHITGIKNVNNAIYNGLNGSDTVSMTAMGDVFYLVDSVGTIMATSVESFNAGLDGDVIILADANVTYGRVTIRGSDGDDVLWSNVGNDSIIGGNGNDIIDGGPGNDLLSGGADNDYIHGGLGTDALFGGAGDDTLVYSVDGLWSGGYTLASFGSAIPFAAMISLDGYNRTYDSFHGDLDDTFTAPVKGTDTLIMTSGNDALILNDYVSPDFGLFTPRVIDVDIIDAGDGNDIVDLSSLPTGDVEILGGQGNDILASSNGDDVLDGGEGNDQLFGSTGNDTLIGGNGDDSYIFNLSDGNDTIIETSGTDKIVFGAGINFNSLSFDVNGTDLLITVGGSTITIQNHFAEDLSGRVENIQFADNSTYDLTSYVPPTPPVATDDTVSGNEDEIITGSVLGNDTDANGDILSVTAGTFTTAQGGTVILNGDGTFSYQGAQDFSGTDSFDYILSDGNGGQDTGNVTINVAAVNDDPVANDDTVSGNEDEIITGNVLYNDTDVDGDTLTVQPQTIVTALGATVILNANGTFSYQGAQNFNGADSFTYTVQDGHGGMDTASVQIQVAAVNDAPAAFDDTFDVFRNGSVTGNVLSDNGNGLDSDLDGDVLSVQAQTITTAMGGTVVLNMDGSFDYTPAHNFYGSDSFDYTLLDGNGGSDTGHVLLNVVLDPSQSIIGTDTNDAMDGTSADDEIFGLGGDDTVKGMDGDDTVYGGDGDDVLYGDDGILSGVTVDKVFNDDILIPNLKEHTNIANLNPSGIPALGIHDGNLNVSYDATASITFRKGYAGYNNSFGVFGIAEDGTLTSSTMLWSNVKTAGIDVTHQIGLPVGANGGDFGFFIIANGDNTNNGYTGLDITGEGNIHFIYNYGKTDARDAKITDNGEKISVVYDDGTTVKVLKGAAYFTTDRDDAATLNRDGKVHVVSGLQDTNNLAFDVKKTDIGERPVSVTKDGITLSALGGGVLVASGDRVGIKTDGNKSSYIHGDETIRVETPAAEKVTLTLSRIESNHTGIDLKIYLDGDMLHPVSYEYEVVKDAVTGKIDIVLNASDFGSGLITAVDISSVANSSLGTEDFYLNSVHADIPGGVDTNSLRIGFEDLPHTGDADYEDVLFDLDINTVTIGDVQGGNDYLDGGAGNDTLYGEGGNDILIIGLGADHAHGGAGADTFALSLVDNMVDTIHDFNAAEGDVINVTDVLEGYDPLSDDINAFVHLVQNGADAELQINATGDTNGAFVTAAIITGGAGLDVATLVADGKLVADQSVLA